MGVPIEGDTRCRTALVRYEDRHSTVTEREIEIQFLYYNMPVWYALAWDRLRNDIRSSASTGSRTSRRYPPNSAYDPPPPS